MFSRRALLLSALPLLAAPSKIAIRKLVTRKYTIGQRDYLFLEIETDSAEFPERVGDRIYYRPGRFTTTLTGPELLALKGTGRVRNTSCRPEPRSRRENPPRERG